MMTYDLFCQKKNKISTLLSDIEAKKFIHLYLYITFCIMCLIISLALRDSMAH